MALEDVAAEEVSIVDGLDVIDDEGFVMVEAELDTEDDWSVAVELVDGVAVEEDCCVMEAGVVEPRLVQTSSGPRGIYEHNYIRTIWENRSTYVH